MGIETMKTRAKIIFINSVIALGAVAIIVVQWPEGMKPHGYGYAAYEEAWASRVFLDALLTGIPVVLYAGAVHVLLSYWLFKPGELQAYKARQLIATIDSEAKARAAEAPATRQAVNHDD